MVTFTLLNNDGTCLFKDAQEQKVVLSVGETNPATYSWIVPRPLIKRVISAAEVVKAYHEQPSGKKLAETIKFLEKEGFVEAAYQLENVETKKFADNKTFIDEFKKNND